MSNGISRRDFLTYSAAMGILIAGGDGMIESVMAMSVKRAAEVDKLTVLGASRQLL